ncbi:MAG: hypothetical protein Fur002_07690 [Anaerolineales bacterium]
MKKNGLFFLIGCLAFGFSCRAASPAPQSEPAPSAAAPASTGQADSSPAAVLPPPTFTPQPTPVPLYFTDEFNGGAGAWEFFQTGGAAAPLTAAQDDQLIVQLSAPNTWMYAIHAAHEYQGVFLQTKFSGAPGGAAGLVCDYSADGWYEFNATSEGAFSVLYGSWLAEGVAQYRPLLNDSSEYLQAGKFDYEIGLTCAEDVLLLHINGKLFRKLDVGYIGLKGGGVGLAAASFDDVPMRAAFEWFTVSLPTP